MQMTSKEPRSGGLGKRCLGWTVCVAVVAALLACGQQGAGGPAEQAVSRNEPARALPAPAAAPTEQTETRAQTHSAQVRPEHMHSTASAVQGGNRQRIIHVSLRAQVDDVYQAVLAIEKEVQAQGGFVVSNAIHTTQQPGRQVAVVHVDAQQRRVTRVYQRTAHLKVRVPSAQTQRFLDDIAKHLAFLEHRQIESRDVQLELLRERLNYRRSQQLQHDLDDVAASDQKKPSVKLDAVQAQDRAQAAQDAAQLAQQELEDQVAFSTIELDLVQSQIVHTSAEPDVDTMVKTAQPGLMQQLRQGLAGGFEMFMSIIVVLAYAWPLLLVMAGVLAGWLVFRKKTAPSGSSTASLPQSGATKEDAQDQK